MFLLTHKNNFDRIRQEIGLPATYHSPGSPQKGDFTMTVKELKKGEFFTLKPIANPTDRQVYIRGDYDREQKKYDCGRYDDISYSRSLKGSTEVYTEFTF